MKWSECAIQDLRKYEGLKNSLESISERLAALNIKNASMKRFRTDTMPTSGGSADWTDVTINDSLNCEYLKRLYLANKRLVRIIEKGLSALSEKERLVLEKFYINRQYNYIEALKETLKLEQSQIYRLKDEALYKFTIHMYGLLEY